MNKKVFSILVALILGISFTVVAQEAAEPEVEVDYFVEWDADGNGTLSQEEFVQGYEADIAAAEEGEEVLGAGETAAELFGQIDTDANGEISAEEFEAGSELL